MHHRIDMVGALRVKGMAQSLQGYRDEAANTLDEALATVSSMTYPYAEAKLLREYGKFHLHAGEAGQARGRLSAALEIFLRLGACKDAEQTRQTLRELDQA